MNLSQLLTGPETDLAAMLDAREQRVWDQRRLLAAFPVTLISFSLNIPGPHKVFPLALDAFQEGLKLVACQCQVWDFPLIHQEIQNNPTGSQAFFSVDTDPRTVKLRMAQLEDSFSMGRLFDLDVLDPQGEKISRQDLGLPERTCLICGGPAFRCSRARAHSLPQLLEKTCRIILAYFDSQAAEKVSRLAVRSLLQEVYTTPKPGLVDLHNSGAHRDMDVSTFEESALALQPFFREFYLFGAEHRDSPPDSLLPRMRTIGLRAELAMRMATGGVNTHKGIIFSMGILLCAMGYCREQGWDRETLRELCRQISSPLQQDFARFRGNTHGQQSYRSYGISGARGEALRGFPCLFSLALPALDRWEALPLQQAGVAALLEIIASAEDTNLISRSSLEQLREIQKDLKAFLKGMPNMDQILLKAEALDREWILRNLSPGGSADLLALAYFIRLCEQLAK